MSNSIDINNRRAIRTYLLKLSPDTTPLWGKMKPQQMIEHLVDQVRYTNGTQTGTCDFSPEEAAQRKQRGVYSKDEIPRNVYLGDLPEAYEYPDLNTAIGRLMKELENFDNHFKTPGITAVHGGFGEMNHEEWLIWHGKHFTHHFKQFGLII